MDEALQGYRGRVREALETAGIKVGDLLRINGRSGTYEGILMPRIETAHDAYIVLKLRSGYNIGIAFEDSMSIERLREAERPHFRPPPIPETKPSLPRVSIISTGGTIASRVDYTTGGVRAAISSRDLLSIIPELSDIAVIDADILFSIFSENMEPSHWSEMARRTAQKIRDGAEGVIITHGTDTMGYSSAALSFALQGLPVPVILVGSQRSSDRPSSDAATNLIGSVKAAIEAPFAEVVLAMHESTSDDSIAFHRGTKVRKCHTSSRYAFRSINSQPLARLKDGRLEMLTDEYRRRGVDELVVRDRFERRVALIKFYPGFDPGILEWLADRGYKGVVLEGTGLGHVGSKCYPSIERLIKEGAAVCMTSQCLWGRVNMRVYSTGRELLRMGVEPLGDMLPETAMVKLMWALGQGEGREEALRLMRLNIAGEYSERTLYEEGET
ncbi:MAG: Glu-tRNA(Gln) amidotransferase subunit GatD [Candidatus Bathyarchaeia archaeon]|nr:Glu-tRNA(Gln) amidotransferase subunit GatD [Candidatus Bathyarchaeota archaeon]